MKYEKLQGQDLINFKAKFKEERDKQGANGVFSFNGKKYNTRLADDDSGNDNDVLKSRINDNDYLKKQSDRYSKDSTDRVNAVSKSVVDKPVISNNKKVYSQDERQQVYRKMERLKGESEEYQTMKEKNRLAKKAMGGMIDERPIGKKVIKTVTNHQKLDPSFTMGVKKSDLTNVNFNNATKIKYTKEKINNNNNTNEQDYNEELKRRKPKMQNGGSPYDIILKNIQDGKNRML